MFKRIVTMEKQVSFTFDEQTISATANDTVAAALLASGIIEFRSSDESGSPRGPYCMIGNCFDCLVEIDGVPNLQACRVAVREGMQVRRQQGHTRLESDDDA